MLARFARGATLLALSTASCADCKDKPTPAVADAASAAPSASASVPPTVTVPSAPSSAAAAPAGDAALALAGDAGPNACALGWGPAEQAFTGGGTLVATATGFDVVYHVDGVPTVRHYDAPKIPPGAVLPLNGAVPTDKPRATEPPCAAAGPFAFCMDRGGNVHRVPRAGGGGTVVAKAKPGTRLTAASTGKETLVGYLVERTTTEGPVTEAWIVGDTAPVTRISEDGTGATHVSLAFSGGDQIAAFYINGRRGMAPIDGLMLTAASGRFVRGKDDVLFVAGGAETNTAGALLTAPGGVAVAYVPIAHDVAFGLLSVHVDGPPNAARDVQWSDYLNGLDPAPVAVTQETPDVPTGPGYVARIRPSAARFGSPRVLELGRATGPNGFEPLGIVPTHGWARDVAMVRDATGALVLLYVDDAGTWIERRVCK
jgi:hypothetical protein